MLFMIFGGLGVVGGGFSLVFVPFINRVASEVNDPALTPMLDLYADPIFPLLIAISFAQAAFITVAGYGLWTMRPWGRRIALTAATVWLIGSVVTSLLTFQWMSGFADVIIEAELASGAPPPPPGFAAVMDAVMIGSIVFSILLYGGLLGWAIFYLRRTDVKRAYGD